MGTGYCLTVIGKVAQPRDGRLEEGGEDEEGGEGGEGGEYLTDSDGEVALTRIHDLEIVHGDLEPGNIVLQFLRLDRIHNLTQDELYRIYGSPRAGHVYQTRNREPPLPASEHPGIPLQVYHALYATPPPELLSLSDAKLLLVGFDSAFMPEKHVRLRACTPYPLHPPESYLKSNTPLGFPSDIWALGCMVWHFFTSLHLFERAFGANELEHLVDVLYPAPNPTAEPSTGEGRRESTPRHSVEGQRVFHECGIDASYTARVTR